MSAFPWDTVLHAAFRLGWPPDVVWRATPRELAAALTPPGVDAPMRQDELTALLRAFPDRPRPSHEEPRHDGER